MKVYRLPSDLANCAIIFDMDNTLYTHNEYAQSQIDLPVKRLADLRKKTFNKMKTEIDEYRRNWTESHNGQTLSLGNVFLEFGISINESILWREELCCPEDHLTEDKQLRITLEVLSSCFQLAIVTNNPVSVAQRTLSVLGVNDLFTNIIGLDTFGISKPDKVHFLKAAELCGVEAVQCISVGDRFDIDITLPLELGMGGILVNGVEDVYRLPDLFAGGGENLIF